MDIAPLPGLLSYTRGDEHKSNIDFRLQQRQNQQQHYMVSSTSTNTTSPIVVLVVSNIETTAPLHQNQSGHRIWEVAKLFQKDLTLYMYCITLIIMPM